jgi:hypothetical protein
MHLLWMLSAATMVMTVNEIKCVYDHVMVRRKLMMKEKDNVKEG